ncbi:uncharacterized protein LOC112639711 [Camponotus floridanus]|uniref:uncharacterized protein LOC112639711 n=1 Tax=Camponotus floridanus TaxID=104421 RepID=UPI000DC66DE2|nr:uncharacterized protein LOC112639711 [Camponotus floridanus]
MVVSMFTCQGNIVDLWKLSIMDPSLKKTDDAHQAKVKENFQHTMNEEARSRVSPIERITIPRLELLAATIRVRLRSIKEAGDFEEEVFFWSDSSTVVAWIRKDKLWNTFVENRVREICSLSDPNKWRHVPGSMNLADLSSRGYPKHPLTKMLIQYRHQQLHHAGIQVVMNDLLETFEFSPTEQQYDK